MRGRNRRPGEENPSTTGGTGQEQGPVEGRCLSSVPPGHSVEIFKLMGGRHFTAKVCALGLTPGSRVKVLSNLGGPIILDVRGSRISLGRGMARKVIVH
ncbi:MAG: FeoA family protein [bacterium]